MDTNNAFRKRSNSVQWEAAIGRMIVQIDGMPSVKSAAKAVKFMKSNGGDLYTNPSVHALYLMRVPEAKGFTRKDVSAFLSNLEEDDELLSTYFRLVHFEGVDILQSLRAYFTKLKLVQLADTAQMNSLLYALAAAFKENGGRFNGDEGDCVRIYNALIMLNDALHHKASVGRGRMTEQGFMDIINDRNQDDIPGFGESEMRRLYKSVQEFPLNEEYKIFSVSSGPSGSQIDEMLCNTLTQHRRKESRTDYLESQLHQLFPQEMDDEQDGVIGNGNTAGGGTSGIGQIDMSVIANTMMDFIPSDTVQGVNNGNVGDMMSAMMNMGTTPSGPSGQRGSTDLGSVHAEMERLNARVLELENLNAQMAKEIEYLQNSKTKLAVESTKCIDSLREMLVSYQMNLRFNR